MRADRKKVILAQTPALEESSNAEAFQAPFTSKTRSTARRNYADHGADAIKEISDGISSRQLRDFELP